MHRQIRGISSQLKRFWKVTHIERERKKEREEEKKNIKLRFAYYLFHVDQKNARISIGMTIWNNVWKIVNSFSIDKVEKCSLFGTKRTIVAFFDGLFQRAIKISCWFNWHCYCWMNAPHTLCNSIPNPFCYLPNYRQFQSQTWTEQSFTWITDFCTQNFFYNMQILAKTPKQKQVHWHMAIIAILITFLKYAWRTVDQNLLGINKKFRKLLVEEN